jgi:uncharacterized damage-inducible protein DinB
MRLSGVTFGGVAVVVISLGAGPVAAQSRPAAAASDNPISQAIRSTWDGAKGNVNQSAEQMPEADFSFKPTDQVRTFGQILAHIAGANYVFCSAARGEKSPFAEDHFEKLGKAKADIVKALTESMTYCDAAYTSLTDRSAAEGITMPFGMGSAARASALINNAVHLQEHYGNLVTYFRIKGMVPPSSRR